MYLFQFELNQPIAYPTVKSRDVLTYIIYKKGTNTSIFFHAFHF
jgi:hypothetical protein